MAHDWILGMLSDLAVYARRNGLGATADACETLRKVAQAEIASRRMAKDDREQLPPQHRRH